MVVAMVAAIMGGEDEAVIIKSCVIGLLADVMSGVL